MTVVDAGQRLLAVGEGRFSAVWLLHFAAAPSPGLLMIKCQTGIGYISVLAMPKIVALD
jgi:hypothetical protein